MAISINNIDEILPQTQCTKCGYKDCYDYAKAIKNNEKHNRCVPGGTKEIKALSTLLNRPIIALDPLCGEHKPRSVAIINEDLCVGCTKCILICPVDAIIGSDNLMHNVIENECTGCELCINSCPMDCISLIEIPKEKQFDNLSSTLLKKQKDQYRLAHKTRLQRIYQKKNEQKITSDNQISDKKEYIKQALKKFRQQKIKTHESKKTSTYF